MKTAYRLIEQELEMLKNEMKELQKTASPVENYAQSVQRLHLAGMIAGLKNALGIMESNASADEYAVGFNNGGEYVLNYLSDLYEGISETDIWGEFIKE